MNLLPQRLILLGALFTLSCSVLAQPKVPQPVMALSPSLDAIKLEREKFEYQKELERQKLEVERLKAWATGGSIFIPLFLGILTLAWQTRTSNSLKDREARDQFDLKAAEILFEGDNTRATKNRAKALTVLFPNRFPENFGDAFEPTQFGGPRYDAKLEVFKAACEKVSTPIDVYRIWHELFPGDKWIKPLIPELAEQASRNSPITVQPVVATDTSRPATERQHS